MVVVRRVAAFFLGGTIAMRRTAAGTLAADGESTFTAPPGVEMRDERLFETSSSHLTRVDVLRVRNRMLAVLAAGHDGAVVVLGTDALAEVAYLLQLTAAFARPVVETGAMRLPEHPGFDGPANVTAALVAAASDDATGLGVLVAMNGAVYSAADVVKVHGYRPDAFQSPWGPIGEIREGEFCLHRRPLLPDALPVDAVPARVAIAYVSFDDPFVLRPYLQDLPDGPVIAGLGAGHLAPGALPDLREILSRGIPVWMVPRRGTHPLLRTYTSSASEIALQELGVRMEDGPPEQARLRLLVDLAAGRGHGA